MKALITGASSGIGKCMAIYLAEKGIDLVLVARRKDKLEELKKQLKNVKVKVIPLDLKEFDNVELLYNEVKKEDIDILINNAGFGLYGTFDETSLEREMEMINVNIKELHYLTKKFLIDFENKKEAYILNVASSAGFMSGPKMATYYATKNYVCRLSEAIYEEQRRKKSSVHISVLCPGPVDTEFNDVANCTFKTKSATAEYVAKYAIDKMFKKKLIIIPTFKMKAAIFGTRFVPKKLLLRINYNVQDKKGK